MNWNDNVNTKDGYKAKLSDFIKEASGVSEVASDCSNLAEVVANIAEIYSDHAEYTEETESGSFDILIPKRNSSALYCIVLMGAQDWNTTGDFSSYIGYMAICLNGGAWTSTDSEIFTTFSEVAITNVEEENNNLKLHYYWEASGSCDKSNIKIIVFRN